MQRAITGFVLDTEGDWCAVLGCGHLQHVRHRPPFNNRPWVITEAGRTGKLGAMLDCVRCARFELPDGLATGRRTPTFDQDSVPAGLLRDHTTRPGTWGRIVVEAGLLRYHVPGLSSVSDLDPHSPGTVVPEVPHRVELLGPVRFHLQFYSITPAS